jgi:hypothetical protein
VRQTYINYWHDQGRFYAKHLRRGDRRIVRFIASDLRYAFGVMRLGLANALKRHRPWIPDRQRGVLVGLLPGLVRGWRDFRDERE